MIRYDVLATYDDSLCREAARLHHAALSYRSFITAFGVEFLQELYRDILADGLGVMIVSRSEDGLCGFVLGCFNTGSMFGVIKRHALKYFRVMVPACLRRPMLIAKIFETLRYVKRESCDVEAELVVMAVDAPHRSQGIGRELLRLLERELAGRGIGRYKVTVHDEMERSRAFYLQNGFSLHHQFAMYGILWDLYVKQIRCT